jgi:hypothetical protein
MKYLLKFLLTLGIFIEKDHESGLIIEPLIKPKDHEYLGKGMKEFLFN